MDRFFLRALLPGFLVAALALGAVLPANADDEPSAESSEEEAPAGIQWIDGWAAGRERATKDGRLIFLYFGRHTPR